LRSTSAPKPRYRQRKNRQTPSAVRDDIDDDDEAAAENVFVDKSNRFALLLNQ
jgi:hypothetical protein